MSVLSMSLDSGDIREQNKKIKALVNESGKAVLTDNVHYSEIHKGYLLECRAEEFLIRKVYHNKLLNPAGEPFNNAT